MTATLIDIINAIIDADVQGDWQVLRPEDIARRAIERCGEGVFEAEAVTDLVSQILARGARQRCAAAHPEAHRHGNPGGRTPGRGSDRGDARTGGARIPEADFGRVGRGGRGLQ
ncbi:MAG: hypothetical protein ACREXU_20965, partial [Gammaproteobacteria bacterium]